MQPNLGTPDQDQELRELISRAIQQSPLKRADIAQALSSKLGIRITEFMLNDFTSGFKKAARFPLLFSAALCEILNDDSIGLFGVRPRIRRLVEFAERELAGQRDQREREALREELLSKHEGK